MPGCLYVQTKRGWQGGGFLCLGKSRWGMAGVQCDGRPAAPWFDRSCLGRHVAAREKPCRSGRTVCGQLNKTKPPCTAGNPCDVSWGGG